MAKFVDIILQAYAHRSSTDELVREIWKAKGMTPPAIVGLSHTSSGIPGSGNYADWVKKYRSQSGGSFLTNFIKNKRKYVIPAGYDVGRIGLVGFSAGCGAVKEILSDPADAKLVDFAYFCDGLHAEWAKKPSFSAAERLSNPEASLQYVSAAGLEGVIEQAKRAAVGVGPAVVVTHSQIMVDYVSTTEAGLYVQRAVEAAVGGQPTQSGINPVGFLAQGGDVPQPPKSDEQGGYWPGSWNPGGCPNTTAKIRGPWPVNNSFAKGWFLRVGFDAHDANNPKCDTRTNSQPAHIFQQQYVLPEVYRHILSERWKTECTEGAVSGFGGLGASQTALAVSQARTDAHGGTIRRNPALLRPVSMGMGLGAGPIACFQEGVFSNLGSSSEIMKEKMLLAGGVGLAAIGGYLIYDLMR